jgi:hypothetical protein
VKKTLRPSRAHSTTCRCSSVSVDGASSFFRSLPATRASDAAPRPPMTLASPWFSPSGAFFGLARIMSAMDTPSFFFGGAKAGRFLTKRSIEALGLCFSGQWSGAVLRRPTAAAL